jgi:hypothetical protein
MIKKFKKDIQDTQVIFQNGKIHHMILLRIYYILIMLIIGLGIIIYDILLNRFTVLPALVLMAIGYLIGFYFSKARKMDWDEEKKLVYLKRFDLTSGILLAIYIIIRIIIKLFLDNYYHNASEVLAGSIALLVGGSAGNFIGFALAIKKTHEENNKINTV